MYYCPNCAYKLSRDSKVCGRCGTPIEIKPFQHLKKYIIAFAVIVVIALSAVFFFVKLYGTPIKIKEINFDPYEGYISIQFKNVSLHDISSVEFVTEFYDQTGNHLNGDSYIFTYSGDLEKGDLDACERYCSLPYATSVIWAKTITVTFEDGETKEYENDDYWATDDFYGGNLRD